MTSHSDKHYGEMKGGGRRQSREPPPTTRAVRENVSLHDKSALRRPGRRALQTWSESEGLDPAAARAAWSLQRASQETSEKERDGMGRSCTLLCVGHIKGV